MNRTNIAAPILGLAILLAFCAPVLASAAHSHEHDEHDVLDVLHSEDTADSFRFGSSSLTPNPPFNGRWSFTSAGSTGSLGSPATLTWSVVPDGTALPGNFVSASGSAGGVNTPSDLISFLDSIHPADNGSPGGADLTQRSWWHLMNSAFNRWDELSGVKYTYEPNDSSANALGTASGQAGVRGDHRIGGHSLDGQTSPTFLAFNFYPNNSDMVIDTDEINRWSNSTNNHRLFRNMMMHEIGHGLGMNHISSSSAGLFLMQPFLASGFDGPQFDDILGAHRLYGDKFEESGGNDTYQNATPIVELLDGLLQAGQTLSVGTDADDIQVAPGDTDFVSIDDDSDSDYFKFSITGPQTVNISLTPKGPTYQEAAQGGTLQSYASAARNDLVLTLFDSDGTTILETANNTLAGFSEEITSRHLSTPGDYYIRVTGLTVDQPQFFQLDVTAVPEPTGLALLTLGTIISSGLRRRR